MVAKSGTLMQTRCPESDNMTAFAKVGDADKLLPEKATVRQLFLNYVNEQKIGRASCRERV